jgi:hypothetical protein
MAARHQPAEGFKRVTIRRAAKAGKMASDGTIAWQIGSREAEKQAQHQHLLC